MLDPYENKAKNSARIMGREIPKNLDPMKELKGGIYRNEAMVYLYHECKMSFEALADATNLAYSTVKKYVLYMFRDALNFAKKIFSKIKNTVREITGRGYYCYIDKIVFSNGEQWCKIGQTTHHPNVRATQMRSRGWKGRYPERIEIMEIIECKDEVSMTNMEDCLRIGMTALNPKKYQKNDRLLSWENDYPRRILDNPFVQMGLAQFAIHA